MDMWVSPIADARSAIMAGKGGPTRTARTGRGGLAAIYLVVMLVALTGIASLAVDWGRVQLVKTQLQRAADAASRAAAAQLGNGVSAVQNAAVTWAGYNTADGSSVVLDSATDVEFGTWDSTNKTFTVLTGAAQSGANAVRVTARRTAATGNAVPLMFGAILGRIGCDAKASVIAMASGGGPSLVGLTTFDSNGYTIDSWNSSVSSYSSFPMNSKAICVSNGSIDCHNAQLKGDCHPGVGKIINNTSGVSGSTSQLTSALSYPVPTAGSAATVNNNANLIGMGYNISTRDWAPGNTTLTVPAGTYYINNLNLNNTTITFTGAVVIYVTGSFSTHNCSITTYQSRPQNLQWLVTTSTSVTLDCDQRAYEVVYAPSCSVTLTGLADHFGAVVGNTLALQSPFHVDESLNGCGVSGITIGTGGISGGGTVSGVK
jgi:hypothetical protein